MDLSEPALADVLTDIEFFEAIKGLLIWHEDRCPKFKQFIQSIDDWADYRTSTEVGQLPFLPVDVFKMSDLYSVDVGELMKEVRSSGTSGSFSKINLDQKTSDLMEQRLIKDTARMIGAERLPMYVIGDRSMFLSRKSLQAREAAVVGLLKFGGPIRFLFRDGRLNGDVLDELVSSSGKSLIVGTTVSVWLDLLPILDERSIRFRGAPIIIHGGGWKRLEGFKVSKETFDNALKVHGNVRVINFYGMTEQLGAVSYECEFGNLHLPSCNRMLIRDPLTGDVLPYNEVGLVQQLSLLPRSYPGVSILTDDLGAMFKGHNCLCKNPNDIIKIDGRYKRADIRGCANVAAK